MRYHTNTGPQHPATRPASKWIARSCAVAVIPSCHAQFADNETGAGGLEPPTSRLTAGRSAIELHPKRPRAASVSNIAGMIAGSGQATVDPGHRHYAGRDPGSAWASGDW